MSARRDFSITKVEIAPEGFYRARIVIDGTAYPVDRRYGSWALLCGETRREVLPYYAAALQARVRPLERREKMSTTPTKEAS